MRTTISPVEMRHPAAFSRAARPTPPPVTGMPFAGWFKAHANIYAPLSEKLTDRAMIPGERVSRVVLTVPGVQSCREVRTRGGPGAVYVDLIVHVDGNMSLRAAHDVADRIEEAIQAEHPEIVDVVVHLEPAERRR